jgi:hypothetical protein
MPEREQNLLPVPSHQDMSARNLRSGKWIEVIMDLKTRLLLGATAVAVLGYVAIVYGGCALDEHCHLRSCYGGRHTCGVIYDPVPSTKAP